MKLLAVVVTLLAVAFSHPLQKRAPLLAADSKTAIEGEYIVVFKKTADDDALKSHMEAVRSQMKNLTKPEEEMKVKSEYRIGRDFRGYSAKMCNQMVEYVREQSEVAYVERNQEVHALVDCTQQQNLASGLWGLERTTLRDWNRNDIYSYDLDAAGEGVDVYILDTGIEMDHPDLESQIDKERSVDFIDNDGDGTDYNGHGTHVAGTVFGNTYGIAKKATGIAVRVLNANGSGTYEQVISGVQYTGNTGAGKKSVANMSLGGGFSQVMNDAVTTAIAQGVSFALAAGNEYGNACSVSPASTPNAVTVGATDDGDIRAAFSNTGNCTDIFAPGVNVLSAYLNGGSSTLSGTSMASPHVAGVMAKILSEQDLSPAQLKAKITEEASPDKIEGIPTDTPNLLVFKDCE